MAKKTPGNLFETLAQQQMGEANAQGTPALRAKSLVPLDDIKQRNSNTRDLNQNHVHALGESIAAVGLIEPLVTDAHHVLLAGGHRLAAIELLRKKNIDAFKDRFPDGLVPVHRMDFDAVAEPDRALEIEISENETRRDYSPQEAREIADRLRTMGYKDTPGRPKAGEKRLKPALSIIFGKSIRTVERYLSDKTPTNGEVLKTPTNGEVFLKRAIANLKQWEKVRGKKKREVSLAKELEDIIARIEKGLGN